jgi:hypothetical protein
MQLAEDADDGVRRQLAALEVVEPQAVAGEAEVQLHIAAVRGG